MFPEQSYVLDPYTLSEEPLASYLSSELMSESPLTTACGVGGVGKASVLSQVPVVAISRCDFQRTLAAPTVPCPLKGVAASGACALHTRPGGAGCWLRIAALCWGLHFASFSAAALPSWCDICSQLSEKPSYGTSSPDRGLTAS